jgi:uncharacterized SAM-binding protein YcdF (DUF218 family)
MVRTTMMVAGTLALVTVVLFIDFAYKTFSLRPRDQRADAIVVLAGGRGRIDEGIRLYREGEARFLFLVGVDPSVRKRDLFREHPGQRGGENVYLEKLSTNTLENALYARELMASHDVRSIILITSRYHMKRATLIFRNVLPPDVAIHPRPVDSRNLKEHWWSHEGSLLLLLGEFYKYCTFRLFFFVTPEELRPMAGDRGAS